MDSNPPYITSAALDEIDYITHGFFSRQGGVSSGIYESLNCGLGSQDTERHILENRMRVVNSLMPGGTLRGVYQIHSNVVITHPSDRRADGHVSRTPFELLGILTADCAPVLIADRTQPVIAAVHAGWKGALSGIIQEAVTLMDSNPSSLVAAIGPCIAEKSYEVDNGFMKHFTDTDNDYTRFFADGADADHQQFDLGGFVAHMCEKAGIGTIDLLGIDTYTDEEDYFSYRRSCHRNEADYGRQISVIGIKG